MSQQLKPTNLERFFGDLQGGTVEKQLAHALSDVSAGVVHHRKVGTVSLKFKIKALGDGPSVMVSSTLEYSAPTSKGSRTEDITYDTQMVVNPGGNVTLFPENQVDMFKTMDEEA